jgi:hypothetical protein
LLCKEENSLLLYLEKENLNQEDRLKIFFSKAKKNKDRNGIRKGMVAVAKMDGSHNIITLGLSKEAAGILAPKLQKSGGRLSLR